MFENQTNEAILRRMLERVPADIDKREGSIIFDALAPAAAELAQAYIKLETVLNLALSDSASEEYLTRRAYDFGVYRKLATKSKRKGVFKNDVEQGIDVPIGSRFSIEKLSYLVVERLSLGQYVLECEIVGVIGNHYYGSLIPVDYVDGLASAELTDILTPGEETESDESLLERLLFRARHAATSGNANHYKQWALEVAGVGDAIVIPEWDGAGTVKVVLLGTNKHAPPIGVVDAATMHINEERPILAGSLTVQGAVEVPINITVSLQLASGVTLEAVIQQIESTTSAYLETLAFRDPLVRVTRIANLLLDIPPIIDYEELLINGGTANIEMAAGEVAVLGVVIANAL